MISKETLVDLGVRADSSELVTWNEHYATGIKLIDDQHMELVNLTNELFRACLTNDKHIKTVFKEVMNRMVAYVRFHFHAEQEILEQIGFPEYSEHKKQHDHLIIKILEAAKEFDDGLRFVPNKFVRTLKDWVFGHIAVYDQIYAHYAAEQRKKGLLTEIEFDN